MGNRTLNLAGAVWTLAIVALFSAYPVAAVETAAAEEDPDISWLFVANATSGTFDGKTLTLHNVPPPLMFSDRPHRVWGDWAAATPAAAPVEARSHEDAPKDHLTSAGTDELPTARTIPVGRLDAGARPRAGIPRRLLFCVSQT